MRFRHLVLGLVGALMVSTGAAQAQPLRAVTADLSPFTINPDAELPGFLHEVVSEMQVRSGVDFAIEYLPWKRAQADAQKTPNTLIFGLTRTKKREPNYDWLVKLLDYNEVFITTNTAVNSYDEAKGVDKVVVLANTPRDRRLTDAGFGNVQRVDKPELTARLLQAGRVSTWFAIDLRAAFIWQQEGYDVADLVFGKSTKQSSLYLAGHPGISDEVKSKLQAAYDSIVADGTFDNLKAKYFGNVSVNTASN